MVSKRLSSSSRPSGRPLLPQRIVDDHKRERCAMALAEVAHETGRAGLTVGLVTQRAKIGRQTFYKLFDGSDAALRYACELGHRLLAEAVQDASEEERPWGEQLEAAFTALIEAVEGRPYLAELCLLDARSTFEPTGCSDAALTEALCALIARGRDTETGIPHGPHAEELLVGGIVGILVGRLHRGGADAVSGLAPQLTALVLRLFPGPPPPSGAAPED